jgi:hypothetical protein
MSISRLALVAGMTFAMAGIVRGEEVKADGRIVSLGLFKNGYAQVEVEAAIPGPGVYLLQDVPEPVHGTFAIQAGFPVQARIVSRMEEAPLGSGDPLELQDALAGTEVTVHFRDGQIPPVTGTVEKLARPAREAARDGNDRGFGAETGYYRPPFIQPGPQGPRFLVLRTSGGVSYVDPSMIAYLQAAGGGARVERARSVLLLKVGETGGAPGKVVLSFLTRGISWAPSYRVDISDPKTLSIEQAAVIRNELASFSDAEVHLISGFPSVRFAHVTSPFSPLASWAAFFQAMASDPGSGRGGRAWAATQQALSNSYDPSMSFPPADLSAIPTGEGVDLHYQAAGRLSLEEGESVFLSIATARAPYARIVEWVIPDNRDWNGRPVRDRSQSDGPDGNADSPWDALRFRNPFSFPMTTAPAMTVAGGRFNGQQMAFWTNPGEEATVRVTKALSVRARHTEQEEEGDRKIVYIGGNDYRRAVVKAEVRVSNHRKEPVQLIVRRRFSGNLLAAEGDPASALLEEGAYSVNPRRELTWNLALGPGEEKTLTYRHDVLVDN